MIFLPLLGAVVQALVSSGVIARWSAFGASVASSLLGMVVVWRVGADGEAAGLVDRLPWIGSYGIHYELGAGGVVAPILLLVSLVFPVLILSEWERRERARGLYGLLLLSQAAVIGTTCAQDLFLLFFFWSLSAIPVFFMVGIWGGPSKEQAAFRGLVANSIGNSLFFAACILIYYANDPHTFLIREIVAAGGVPAKLISVAGIQTTVSGLAFLLVCAGLALRAPVWPLHGWFWQISSQAPASVFVCVAGIMVPAAGLVFVRLSHQLFPAVLSASAPWIAGAGVVSLLVGSVTILAQRRLSSVVAHLVLIQVGLGLLGMGSGNASALVGAIFQQLGAGLAVAAMGLLFGSLAQHWGVVEAPETSGGLVERAPLFAGVMALSVGAFLGVPGLSGFVGQSLVVLGAFASRPITLLLVGVSFLLVTFSLFGVFERVFLGRLGEAAKVSPRESELPARERLLLMPLVLAMLLLGFYPKPFLDRIRPEAGNLIHEAPAAVGVSTAPGPAASPVPSVAPSPTQPGTPSGAPRVEPEANNG